MRNIKSGVLIIYGQIVKGPQKTECEDSAFIYLKDSAPIFLNESRFEYDVKLPFAIGLADGVGGNTGGRRASAFAVKAFSQKISSFNISEEESSSSLKDVNSQLISYANEISGCEQMATTFTAMIISAEKGIFAHTGNTRICQLNGSYLKQLTDDHTMYQYLLDTGNFEGAENCNRNMINSCLGGGRDDYLRNLDVKAFYEEKIPSGFIMTSDGIHEYVDLDFLEDTLSRSDISELDKTDLIIKEALKNNSEDDKSIVIIK